MWLLAQIVFYLLGAFAIGATGSWILRGRLADDSHDHLRQRFRQMVSSSEMERDAAKLRVRELSVEVRRLEEKLRGLGVEHTSEVEDTSDLEDTGEDETAFTPTDQGSMGDSLAARRVTAEPMAIAVLDEEVTRPKPAEHVSTLFAEAETTGSNPEAEANQISAEVESEADLFDVVDELPDVEVNTVESNGALAEAVEIEVVEVDAAQPDAEPEFPAPTTTNGEGVAHRFELIDEEPAGDVGAKTPGPPGTPGTPGTPGVDSDLQDTVGVHTWASPDRLTGAARAATEAPANGRPFSDLGDIAPAISERLRGMGIHNTSDLHKHFRSGGSPAELARTLDVEVRKVRRWRVLSELMEVPEVGPESAWLLEISGLASVGELAAEDPRELVSRMAALNADQGLGLPVPETVMVASWVEWASLRSASTGR